MENNSYLLDTHYAEYIKNYLSEFYPKSLLKMQMDDSLESFILNIAERGSEEYHNYFEALPKGDIERQNTNNLMAVEYANGVMKELIQAEL